MIDMVDGYFCNIGFPVTLPFIHAPSILPFCEPLADTDILLLCGVQAYFKNVQIYHSIIM